MTYMTVTTQQNDTLDLICYRTLGRTDMITDVINANPHAIRSPILQAGLTIRLPNVPKPKPKRATIKLWD